MSHLPKEHAPTEEEAQSLAEWISKLQGTTYIEDNGDGQMEKHDKSGVVTMVGGIGAKGGGSSTACVGTSAVHLAITDALKKQVIDSLVQDAWRTAELSGFHEDNREFGTEIALMHSELTEALEAARLGTDFEDIQFPNGEDGKVEGVAAEFADVIIRIFDVCGQRNIPLADALRLKMKYNKSRPYKHGKQF